MRHVKERRGWEKERERRSEEEKLTPKEKVQGNGGWRARGEREKDIYKRESVCVCEEEG